MSMYFVGIDISKYKHDCCIISAADQQIVSKFTIANDKDGFEHLLTTLNSLSNPEDIKIGFESTAHYALNLELFLENAHHSFMEVNPVLIKEYKKSTSLRRTKTDSVDCESIARWLMTVEYKPHSKGFYHAYSLKSLTRLRDRLIRQRSFLPCEDNQCFRSYLPRNSNHSSISGCPKLPSISLKTMALPKKWHI